MTLLLHSLGANYNQFGESRHQSQVGERGPGSIVITPEGRGPDGWYYGHAGADTFEVWADVARRYRLDPRWTAISGYSMGGYGTYKLATQHPDLFARANPIVGPPGLGIWVPPAPPQPGGDKSNTNRMLASVRNIPFLIWNGSQDELVPAAGPVEQAQTFDDLGYRYKFDLFTNADHFAFAVNDQYAPAAAFLGTHETILNPPHVTYVVNPTMDFPGAGTVADHAYWLSGLKLRDSGGSAPLGKVDARSEGFGLERSRGESDPNSAGDAPGRQPRPDALHGAVEELGARPAGNRPKRPPSRCGEPGPGGRPPRSRPPQLLPAARRHHRRTADRRARRLRPDAHLRRPIAGRRRPRRRESHHSLRLAARRWTSS